MAISESKTPEQMLEEASRQMRNQVILTCARHLGGSCDKCSPALAEIDHLARVARLVGALGQHGHTSSCHECQSFMVCEERDRLMGEIKDIG